MSLYASSHNCIDPFVKIYVNGLANKGHRYISRTSVLRVAHKCSIQLRNRNPFAIPTRFTLNSSRLRQSYQFVDTVYQLQWKETVEVRGEHSICDTYSSLLCPRVSLSRQRAELCVKFSRFSGKCIS